MTRDRLAIRLTPEDDADLEALASALRTTRSDAVRRAVRHMLADPRRPLGHRLRATEAE